MTVSFVTAEISFGFFVKFLFVNQVISICPNCDIPIMDMRQALAVTILIIFMVWRNQGTQTLTWVLIKKKVTEGFWICREK